MHLNSWVLEIVIFIFFAILLIQGRKIFGRDNTSIFLWGSIIWTGTIENMMVMTGGYDYFAYANFYRFGERVIQGYPGWVFFVLFVPLCICIGWFVISFPAIIFSIRLMGEKTSIWIKAAIGGIFCVSFDMLLDPISVVNEWWRWTHPHFYYHGVPVSNYMGWFFLVFFYGAVYERSVLQRKGFRWLNAIERLIFRADTSDMTDMDIQKVARVFYFRVVAFLPVFVVVSMVITNTVMVFFTNNFGPFDSVFPNNLFYQFVSMPK